MTNTHINKLINKTYEFNKLNKTQMQSHIEKIITDNPALLDDETLGFFIANAYKYFMPALPKKVKTAYDWLAKAKSKEQTRYYLNEVYCDGDFLIATDGHRLHFTKNTFGLNVGYVNHKMQNSDFEGTFPQHWQNVYDHDMKNEKTVKVSDLEVIEIDNKTHAYALPCGRHMNQKYLQDAINCDDVFTYKHNDNLSSPILITSCEFGDVVLMPMRVK